MLLSSNHITQNFMVGTSYFHRVTISMCLYCPIRWQSKKRMGTKQLEQLKHFSIKIQKMISNIAVTEKNEK